MDKILETGDILLFCNNDGTSYWTIFSDFIKYFTHSNYTHVGMIVKDPSFTDKNLKGLYLWESSWEGVPDAEDHELKLGVQLQPLSIILDKYKNETITYRKIKYNGNKFNDKIMKEIHAVVHNRPYDIVPNDWINGIFRRDTAPQKTSRFWCSALVGYIYTKCGIIYADTDWSVLRPSDFTLGGENLSFSKDCSLEPCETKLI